VAFEDAHWSPYLHLKHEFCAQPSGQTGAESADARAPDKIELGSNRFMGWLPHARFGPIAWQGESAQHHSRPGGNNAHVPPEIFCDNRLC